MSLLEQVQRGRAPMPPRIMLYGIEGIGKSTFTSQAPARIFVPTEDGLSEINCERFPLAKSVDDVLTAALPEPVLAGEYGDYDEAEIPL
jgi:hypothetical protein